MGRKGRGDSEFGGVVEAGPPTVSPSLKGSLPSAGPLSSEMALSRPSISTGFLGVFHHSIDDKGRVSFPLDFRTRLTEGRVVLTNFVSDGARCIEGFDLLEWEQFIGELKRRSRFDPKLRQLENFYLSRAHLCALDSSGRIIVPQHLRQYAGLNREVVFSSSLNGFRLWDTRVWELVLKETESALVENPALFLGIDRGEG